MSNTLHVGDKAPAFEAPDQAEKIHRLEDYVGRWLLLYFYPKDGTPGCTTEACGIRDAWTLFEDSKTAVLGVSADSVKGHQKFAKNHKLPFPILSDPEKKIIKAYGVWGKKNMFGRTYDGILRMSFIINPQGKIAKIYPKVTPEGHAAQALKDIKELKG